MATTAYVIAPAPARCATPNCTGHNVRTIRGQAAGSTAWVTVDLCFDCRGAVLDCGGRYVIERAAARLGAVLAEARS